MFNMPLSADDLAALSGAVREWNRLLIDKEGAFRPRSNMVSRIELHHPDDVSEIIGHIVLEDGWVGFRPVEGSHGK